MGFYSPQIIGGSGVGGGGSSFDFADIGRFTGFSEAGALAGAVLTYTEMPRAFQISPAQESFNYYIKGQKFTVTEQMSVTFDDASGLHVIYFDGAILTSKLIGDVTVRLFKDVCLVGYIIFDSDIQKVTRFGGELHGSNASEDLHAYLHNVEGTRYAGGLRPILNSTDVLNFDPQIIVGAGVLYDEDIRLEIPPRGVNPETSPAQIPIYYKEGAFDNFFWKAKAPNNYCVINQGAQDFAGNFLNFSAEYPLLNRQVTSGGVQDLHLDSMVNSLYSQQYVESTKFGTIANRFYTEDSNFLIYKYDAGGGIFYVCAYNTDSENYVVIRTTTDPDLWISGERYTMSQSETVTPLVELYAGKKRPSAASPLVTYSVSGGTSVWGLYETQPGDIFLMHLFGDNQKNEAGSFGDVLLICGENIYPNIQEASQAAPFEISDLVTEGLPLQEFRAIASFIVEVISDTENFTRSIFRRAENGEFFQDFRNTQTRSIGGADTSNHNQLSGLQGGTANEHYHFTRDEHTALLALI